MDLNDLITLKENQLAGKGYIEFTTNELDALSASDVQHIIDVFHGHTLMKLPPEEIRFFEWLKEADLNVWDDLWSDSEETMYLVSVDFLNRFVNQKKGFPICDLMDEPNFWFSPKHIKPKGIEHLDTVFHKLDQNMRLSLPEFFLYMLNDASFDIWHFCYKNKLKLDKVKAAVDEMVYNGWLVHLSERDDLVRYLDIDC